MTIVAPSLARLIRTCWPWLGLSLLAWVLATMPLITVVGLVGALGGAFLLLRWPWLLWLGLALVLPVSSGIKLGPLSWTELGLGTAVALWLLDGVRRRSLRLELSLPLLATLLYVGALLLALLGAQNLREAVAEVVKWLEVMLVVAVLPPMLSVQQARWLVVALLLGGIGQAGLGLYQFIFQIGPEWFIILGRFMRASGTFFQPNPYAGYLGLCLPVAASLALWSWQKVGRQIESHEAAAHKQPLWWALFYSGATGLIGAGLAASWSRGGWLGATVALGAIVALRSRRALIAEGTGGLLLLSTMLVGSAMPTWIPVPISARLQAIPAYFGFVDLQTQTVNDDNFAVLERLAHWVAALRMWEQAPWLGIGPGNYATVYPQVHLSRWEDALGHAHNIYLNALAESGITGLSVYLLMWVLIGRWIWQQRRVATQRQATWTAALAIGSLGIVIHSLVHNFFDHIFVQGIYLQMAFWLAALQVVALVDTAGEDGHG